MKERIPPSPDTQTQRYALPDTRPSIDASIVHGSKRTHAGHASYGVLAVMTTLLILNGCDSSRPTERADAQVNEVRRELESNGVSLKRGDTLPADTLEETGIKK